MNDRNTLPTVGEKGEIVLYQPDESIRLEVRLEDETVWLTQAQMGVLFGTNRQAITKHVKNIFESGELDRDATSSILELVQREGNRNVKRKIEYYNLDVIISVGFRVNTKQGIHFRTWANNILKQFMLRGYSVNQHLVALKERVDNRLVTIESELAEQRKKVDFLIEREKPVTE